LKHCEKDIVEGPDGIFHFADSFNEKYEVSSQVEKNYGKEKVL
jgi:hypothetical protein